MIGPKHILTAAHCYGTFGNHVGPHLQLLNQDSTFFACPAFDGDEDLLLDPVSHGKDYPKIRLTCCGERHLSGRAALAYARCRHIEQGCKDGDFGRARRQQKVIFAIRNKVFSPENFPTLLAQAPQLYNTFSNGIHTTGAG